jgi:FkbM family methyltransferase
VSSTQLEAQPLLRTGAGFVSFHREGDNAVNFFINDESDEIQRQNARGKFYEIDELQRISGSVGKGARILDIGANIGNHMLFFAKIMQAAIVVPIEPTPRGARHLRENAELNFVKNVDFSFLGRAFGAGPGRGRLIEPEGNLGGSRIRSEGGGEIEIIDADSALGAREFDFVKIDVEGSEIDVLKGMPKLIARCKMQMYVEVNEYNETRFHEWLRGTKYKSLWTHKRYRANQNYFLKWED